MWKMNETKVLDIEGGDRLVLKEGRVMPVVLYGAPVLRRRAVEVSSVDSEVLVEVVASLFATMESAKGIGLAAPQIGLPVRIFVVDTHNAAVSSRYNLDNSSPLKEVFINPEIVWRSEELNVYEEGCLSIPGVYAEVRRPERVKVVYTNLRGERVERDLHGLPARVVQHEYDHLEGRLFVDYLSPIMRSGLARRLKDIEKGRVDVDYPVTHNPQIPEDWHMMFLGTKSQ